MEQLTIDTRARPIPSFRRSDALEAAAWRAPTTRRFDSRPANDGLDPVAASEPVEIPRWAVVVGGGVVAALMGALLGGAMAL